MAGLYDGPMSDASSVTAEQLAGFVATKSGRTDVILRLAGDEAFLTVTSRWMGSDPLELVLVCRHKVTGSHAGALILRSAHRVDADEPVPIPPTDGAIVIEYVRVPSQEAPVAGSDTMSVVGHWTDPFTMVLWLHRDAAFDDGTDLDPGEYDVPPESFRPVVRALGWLERPWKLAPASDQ